MPRVRRQPAARSATRRPDIGDGAHPDRQPGPRGEGSRKRHSLFRPVGGSTARVDRVSTEDFYDERRIAIVPMGLCYPGRLPSGGDAPPRPECAPLWRDRLLAHMPDLRLTLLVGGYAQTDAFGAGKMTERVMTFRDYLPAIFPLPHPSWRSRHWATKNPWFDADVLPALRCAVQLALG